MYREDAKEIHILLMTFMGAIHEKFFINMRKYNISCSQISKNQIKIINVLYQNDGLTATEIGKMLDIEKGSLTAMVDQLKAMGLITRTIDVNDRRRVLLSLTAAGIEHMDKMMEVYSEAMADLFREVDPQDMEEFIDHLRHLTEFMAKL